VFPVINKIAQIPLRSSLSAATSSYLKLVRLYCEQPVCNESRLLLGSSFVVRCLRYLIDAVNACVNVECVHTFTIPSTPSITLVVTVSSDKLSDTFAILTLKM
jgi:hypothetical protein